MKFHGFCSRSDIALDRLTWNDPFHVWPVAFMLQMTWVKQYRS